MLCTLSSRAKFSTRSENSELKGETHFETNNQRSNLRRTVRGTYHGRHFHQNPNRRGLLHAAIFVHVAGGLDIGRKVGNDVRRAVRLDGLNRNPGVCFGRRNRLSLQTDFRVFGGLYNSSVVLRKVFKVVAERELQKSFRGEFNRNVDSLRNRNELALHRLELRNRRADNVVGAFH